ncbi:hydroxymethylbilane synthase [Dermatobacter hominis]|uniref:hydroxymethylbilane synthase n=1 Tax=Dermatobacter hominis TaxID=2884263 RepID=UPI001D0FA8D2|nr:hydroxymethylbilane synthase [Dermatobacter hominis]UDY33997.1 hydroxymethylbilane synthase [Dermatobacter hominis]
MRVRIAARASPLARWQADHVASLIRSVRADVDVVVEPLSTEGDRRTDVPLSEIGGKGVFATEVQAAVLDGRADLAVHSGKDLPARTPDGLVIAAVPERGDVRDALVGRRLVDLPTDGIVATGSARRRVQLAHLRPDLRFAELRGNMATRLRKAEDFDAIVVAAVALERLGLGDRLTDVLPATLVVPQVAQGALVVECRLDDGPLRSLLSRIEHAPSRRTVDAERAFLTELGGDCTLPAGAHATLLPDESDGPGVLSVRAILGGEPDADGRVEVHHGVEVGDDPERVGATLAARLRAQVDAAGRGPGGAA